MGLIYWLYVVTWILQLYLLELVGSSDYMDPLIILYLLELHGSSDYIGFSYLDHLVILSTQSERDG